MTIFNPDSKFMYWLGVTGDFIILNVLFFVFSLPLVTCGAAQAGLYTGIRNILDRETANTPTKTFLKGFKNGFKKITLLWTILLACILLLGYSIYIMYANRLDAKVPAIVAIVGMVILCIFSSVLALFHSRFDCTKMQLLRNTVLMMCMYPLRCLIVGVAFWFPFSLILLNEYILLLGTPIWIGIYFAVALQLGAWAMTKPFNKIINPDGENKQEVKEESEKEN